MIKYLFVKYGPEQSHYDSMTVVNHSFPKDWEVISITEDSTRFYVKFQDGGNKVWNKSNLISWVVK